MTPDPFQTLGVDARFDLDLAALEKRHRELSRALHPDRHAGKSAAERRQALGKAIEVNEAWRTLRDPLARAEALLRRAGVHVTEGEEPKPDPDLLMDMMEKREALAEVRQNRDERALASLRSEIEARQEAALVRLSQLFSGDVAADRGPALTLLGELRYLRRFLDEAGAIEDELF